MTTSYWLRPHNFKMPDMTADVVIIGAGFVGLSTGYWISELRPDLKIIIIDRSHVGAGASGRNAGFLTKGSATFYKSLSEKWGKEKALSIFDYAKTSLSLVHRHLLKVSPEIKFSECSSLTLHKVEPKASDFDFSSFNFQWRNSEHLPTFLNNKFFGAYENDSEYKVNPLQMLSSLRTILEARKIQIIEDLSAFEVTSAGVATEYNQIKSKQIALALNGYLPQFHSNLKNFIIARRAQMLAVEVDTEIDSESLHYDSPERVYWRKANDKTLLIGGKRLLDESNEVGDFEKISSKVQLGLEQYLKETLNLDYKVMHRWSGIMGFTDNELPLIKKVLAPVETFIIGGFSGHGMGFGFHSGKELAEMMTGQRSHSVFDEFNKTEVNL